MSLSLCLAVPLSMYIYIYVYVTHGISFVMRLYVCLSCVVYLYPSMCMSCSCPLDVVRSLCCAFARSIGVAGCVYIHMYVCRECVAVFVLGPPLALALDIVLYVDRDRSRYVYIVIVLCRDVVVNSFRSMYVYIHRNLCTHTQTCIYMYIYIYIICALDATIARALHHKEREREKWRRLGLCAVRMIQIYRYLYIDVCIDM